MLEKPHHITLIYHKLTFGCNPIFFERFFWRRNLKVEIISATLNGKLLAKSDIKLDVYFQIRRAPKNLEFGYSLRKIFSNHLLNFSCGATTFRSVFPGRRLEKWAFFGSSKNFVCFHSFIGAPSTSIYFIFEQAGQAN